MATLSLPFLDTQPTDIAMPSMAPIPDTRSPRVDVRYQPWTKLSPEDKSIAEQLGYDETNWNKLGSNPVKNLNWERLPCNQNNAARALGYDLYSWDCWQNHFQSYRWIYLDVLYVQAGQWWKTLGWDIYKWNRYQDPPESDGMSWYELGDNQHKVAAQLCYFRLSWDEGGYCTTVIPSRGRSFDTDIGWSWARRRGWQRTGGSSIRC